MGQTVEALSSSPTLTSSEEDDNNGDGPDLAEIKNARGTRGNTNSHATTKKGKYKGKGKAANQPQVSAKGDAHNAKGSSARNSTPPRPHPEREGREKREGVRMTTGLAGNASLRSLPARLEEAQSTGSLSTGRSKAIMTKRELGHHKVQQTPQTKAKAESKGVHVTTREGKG